MTAPGLVCGSCGTELASNAKSYNQSAVLPSLRGCFEMRPDHSESAPQSPHCR